jgi:tol-pal system protein YbgF
VTRAERPPRSASSGGGRPRWAAAALPLAVLLAPSGCFATRRDVRILQGDLAAIRADLARQDSLRAQREASEAARVSASLAVIVDSLRASSARVNRWQANVQGDLRAMQEQLLQIQELTGQSQRRIQELRADIESRREGGTVPPPTTGGATPGTTDSTAAAAGPGPNQLYQLADQQLRRGSYGAARAAYEELLRTYPTSDLAPEAQFYIGETYAAERNEPVADSVYQLVVSQYPRSPRAATALYKHGLIMQRAGRTAEARTAFERVRRDYPRSDEATLAGEALRALRE